MDKKRAVNHATGLAGGVVTPKRGYYSLSYKELLKIWSSFRLYIVFAVVTGRPKIGLFCY